VTALSGRIDSAFIEQEVALLGREIADHDIAARYETGARLDDSTC